MIISLRRFSTIINNRKFTGHALDTMQNRGIMPTVVENVIENGIRFTTVDPHKIGYFDSKNKIYVILDGETERVVTVVHGVPNI